MFHRLLLYKFMIIFTKRLIESDFVEPYVYKLDNNHFASLKYMKDLTQLQLNI